FWILLKGSKVKVSSDFKLLLPASGLLIPLSIEEQPTIITAQKKAKILFIISLSLIDYFES
ncbi:hypothetical protein OFO11_40930, partial [Escherichia coli]|nr:hypothetical protein [Escherichia coli]